jgi:hypothetical protein
MSIFYHEIPSTISENLLRHLENVIINFDVMNEEIDTLIAETKAMMMEHLQMNSPDQVSKITHTESLAIQLYGTENGLYTGVLVKIKKTEEDRGKFYGEGVAGNTVFSFLFNCGNNEEFRGKVIQLFSVVDGQGRPFEIYSAKPEDEWEHAVIMALYRDNLNSVDFTSVFFEGRREEEKSDDSFVLQVEDHEKKDDVFYLSP